MRENFTSTTEFDRASALGVNDRAPIGVIHFPYDEMVHGLSIFPLPETFHSFAAS